MSKKILNARLIIGPRIESVSYILKRQITVFWEKKNVILGRNELSFRDQDVRRSREQQYSNIFLFFYLKEDIGHWHEWFTPEKKIWGQISFNRPLARSVDSWPHNDQITLRPKRCGGTGIFSFKSPGIACEKITLHCFTKCFLAAKKLCIRLDSAAV